jgi:uncharacterized protein YhhL (DUF1145 family)
MSWATFFHKLIWSPWLRCSLTIREPERQGCQMAYFQTKIHIWVNFGGVCNGRCCTLYGYFVYFTAIWDNFWQFGKLLATWFMYVCFWFILSRKIWQPFNAYLKYLMLIWYIFQVLVYFSSLGILYQEKSGNPGQSGFVNGADTEPVAAFQLK